MKKEKMNAMVSDELSNIPKGMITASPQRILRLYYNMQRRHDLAKNPHTPARESLFSAIR